MKDSTNKRQVIVGIFTLIGLLFLGIGILTIGNLHETFKQKVRITALFDDVSGLQVGNNIWYQGVKIGTVSGLELSDKKKVKVILKIEDTQLGHIRKDAFVKLSSDGFIGNKILIIYGGTDGAQPVTEGDILGVEKTFTSDDMINTLQENNKNMLAITANFKVITQNLVAGNGTVGKLLSNNDIYNQLNAATLSLQHTSSKAQLLINSLNTFTDGLNKKGTLAHELTSDTIVFASVLSAVLDLTHMVDTVSVFVNNLKDAGKNPKSAIGVLLRDEEAGASIKQTLKNLESGSHKLDEDLEAAQHNIFLRGYFKKKEKEKLKEAERKK